MLNNQKGIIALAIILSMLMVIGAIAVFGLVSGRFGISHKLNNRVQAILDAESASHVAYMMMRDNIWTRTDSNASAKKVQFAHREVKINISDVANNQVKASPLR